jgi:hypothetical protein
MEMFVAFTLYDYSGGTVGIFRPFCLNVFFQVNISEKVESKKSLSNIFFEFPPQKRESPHSSE